MFTKNTLCKTLIAGSLVLGTTVSYAVPTHTPDITPSGVFEQFGEIWRLQYFRDNHPVHPGGGNIRFCFIRTADSGTHSRYRWYVIGIPLWFQWNGMATKEGDQVFMNGVRRYRWNTRWSYPDYMQWDLASYSLGTGHWRLWFNNNPQWFGHYNIIMTRTRQRCQPQRQQEFPVDKVAEIPALPPEVKADDPESLLLYFGSDNKPTAESKDAIFDQGVIKIPSINIPNDNGNIRSYDVEMSLVPDENEILFRLEKAIPIE
jgi:hypothetical protein